jgi:S-formylglutathione hydrolase FrmB
VLTRVIPGTLSGFAARPARVYLPPAYRTQPHRRFPVLELLHGTNGSPGDWLRRGAAKASLDAFAARHGGAAPIVVMPDINGRLQDDTECVRSRTGASVERYLTEDVPNYVRAHFPAADRKHWSVAGLSEGGTCAVMLALRHPRTLAVFGEFSGLTRATVGETDDTADTVAQLFGGSRAAYDRHDPLWLLRHHSYRGLSGFFVSGAQDAATRAAQSQLVAASRRAGIAVQASLLPGSHSWAVWSVALRAMLPWLWARSAQ